MTWSNGDLATAATAVIALGALLRPDIERLVRRRRAHIDMHLAGRLEVGFSTFGATIGLQGTLQAVGVDGFVSYSRLTVERVADNLRHEFQWAVFRGVQLSPSLDTSEIASGFLLSVAAPRRFSIQFHDSGTADSLRQALTDLQRLWMDYLQSQKITLSGSTPAQVQHYFDQFHQMHLPNITPLYQVVDRQFYWVAGEYRMRVELHTARPSKIYYFDYRFSLTEADSNLLRLNCVGCLRATCGVPNFTFNFVYPKYQSA